MTIANTTYTSPPRNTAPEDQILERRYRVLGRNSPTFYDRPLHLVKGRGVWVEDASGRRYLDCYNNVPSVGHCHPRVVEALCRQAGMLNLHTRYLHETVVEYAERLTALFDPSLSVAMFCCSGTEANELALRLARQWTGGTGLIVSDFSYHGNSASLAAASTGIPAAEALASHVRAIHIPDLYRDGIGMDEVEIAALYADKVQEAIDSLEKDGIKIAAMIVDPIFSTEGLLNIPRGFYDAAVARVRAAGGVYIADEVQPGFGRMGDKMWGHQHYKTVPDIVTMGKPMGNGHPIGGLVTRPELLERFGQNSLYFNTFGGNPVSSAVGLAVLDVIRDEHLVERARRIGDYVRQALFGLRDHHDIIGDVRGRGLFFGLELVEDRISKRPAITKTKTLINLMVEKGVLISKIGPRENVLKMRPPLVFQEADADILIHALDQTLSKL